MTLRLPSLTVFLLLMLLATPPPAGAASPNEPATDPVILVLGDSLSAGYGLDPHTGWVWLLQQRLDEQGYRYHVANASVSGDTTSGGLARLPSALDRNHPSIVLIELGGNDGLRALPLKALQDNLGKLVDLSLAARTRVLLFEMRIPSNYGPVYTDGFTRSFGQVAQEHQAILVPFFLQSLMLSPEAFQDDGIHPNAQSQAKMLDAVWPSLQPLLQKSRTPAPAAPSAK